MRLTNDEKAILLGLLEDMSDEDDIEQQPMDIKETIVSVIGKLGGTYFGKFDNVAKDIIRTGGMKYGTKRKNNCCNNGESLDSCSCRNNNLIINMLWRREFVAHIVTS